MSHPLFAIAGSKNRNGVDCFGGEGCLNGVRIRRNYKNKEEPAAEKAILELKALRAARRETSVN